MEPVGARINGTRRLNWYYREQTSEPAGFFIGGHKKCLFGVNSIYAGLEIFATLLGCYEAALAKL